MTKKRTSNAAAPDAKKLKEMGITLEEKQADRWLAEATGSTVTSETPALMQSALDNIGNTPLIRCQAIEKEYGLECELYAKCEFFNAGGSVKDRIAKRMVLDAEASGRLKKGDTIIEPTSGNTGIGLALAAAIRGYKCIICLPEKMSLEKINVLKALGAQIVRTPTEAAWDSPDSHISVARRMNAEIPNSHILDQYSNHANPLAHYDGTAEEIIHQCGGSLDMLVAGAGTGGTITGIAKKMNLKVPQCKIVGVDPCGSMLAIPDTLNDFRRNMPNLVEGIGYDFIPEVLDRSLMDAWEKSEDEESFLMMRKLIRTEGLLCGGSAGSAMYCAVRAAKELKKGQKCVVVLSDSVRNYMTKALSDDWMIDNGFTDDKIVMKKSFSEHWWDSKKVSELDIKTPLTVQDNVSVKDAIDLLKTEGFDMVPVIGEDGSIKGVVTEGNMTAKILGGKASINDPISKVLYKNFCKVGMNSTLGDVAGKFDHESFALVVTEQKNYGGASPRAMNVKTVISGIITRIDLLDYISKEQTSRK